MSERKKKSSRRMEAQARFWAYWGGLTITMSFLACIAILVALWRSEVRGVRNEMESYTRAEALAVSRLLLYDLASDPRVARMHVLERNIQGIGLKKAPEREVTFDVRTFVERNLELPDTEIWMEAKRAGLTSLTIEEVAIARRAIYERVLMEMAAGVQDDLWARATFSDHLRGVRLRSAGGLVILSAGEDLPPQADLPSGRATLDLSPERLLVVLPLYTQSAKWGTAYLLVDRSFMATLTGNLTRTVNLGLWILSGLLLVLLATWSAWWAFMTSRMRKKVVIPIVSLAKRMEGWAQESPEAVPDSYEPQWLSEAFDRLLVRIKDQQEQLLRAQRMGLLERIGAGLSHEINNALNPARLRLEEIMLDGRTPQPDDLSALKEYLSSAQRILKDLSLATRQSVAPPKRLIPAQWLSVARRLVEPHFVKGPHLRWLAKEEEPAVIGDEQALVQVAVNLLLNARDAVEGQGDAGLVEVVLEQRAGRVVLTVSDNGEGVSPEVIDHLFEPFVTSKAKGSGLGLFVVDTLLRRMGGTIKIEAAEGGGTVASVTLKEPDSP
jgi:signal transduction histidine kinase